jgi:general secretion pathway protein L
LKRSIQASPANFRYFRSLRVGTFFRWWSAGLLACLPSSAQRVLRPTPARVILGIDGDEIVASQDMDGEARELGRCSLQVPDMENLLQNLPKSKQEQVILLLPTDKVLSKVISLPLAAEGNLRQVVGFEIDRLTPFSLEQVYYDAAVVERQPAVRRVQVRLAVAVRSLVNTLLERLAGIGVSPDIVSVAGADANVNLLPLEKRPRKNKTADRARWALLLVALALVTAAALLPVWQQRALVVTLMPKVQAAQVKAERIFQLREELDSSLGSSRFLIQEKRDTLPVVDILNELTRIIPDNTWVEQFDVTDRTVQIRGQSLAASSLIGLIEASKMFEGVTFLSPVTADRRTGRERFFLSAQVAATQS